MNSCNPALLADLEKDLLTNLTAELALIMRTKVAEISLHIGKNRQVLSDKILPIFPGDFLSLQLGQFQALIETHLPRLELCFGPAIKKKLEKDYMTLIAELGGEKNRQLREKIIMDSKGGFGMAWQEIGDKVPTLRTIACGFATVFATTGQVEGDFSRIKFARNSWRKSLADVTLEGYLYAKQFDKILMLL